MNIYLLRYNFESRDHLIKFWIAWPSHQCKIIKHFPIKQFHCLKKDTSFGTDNGGFQINITIFISSILKRITLHWTTAYICWVKEGLPFIIRRKNVPHFKKAHREGREGSSSSLMCVSTFFLIEALGKRSTTSAANEKIRAFLAVSASTPRALK